jgi:radical SAM protein with 4Fe4S-binding SPASM domain
MSRGAVTTAPARRSASAGKFLHSLLPLRFDWIQVEVSTYCNARCFYCPHTTLRDRWVNRNMTLETFERIVPSFKRTELVHLQGWGEPFLNPHFIIMAEEAKKAGCRVGTTSNGTALDASLREAVVRTGVDVLSFSLAHSDPSHDSVRQGACLEEVLDTVRSMNAEKKRQGTNNPSIHVSYLLLRSNKDDVKNLPSLLAGLGVDEVVVSTLDFVSTPDLAKEALFPQTPEEYESLRSFLESVRLEGERAGVPIHYQIPYAGRRRLLCSENIERAVVISAAGDVYPCVFMNTPRSSDMMGGERPVFGNVNERPLEDIWWSKEYKNFRRSFYQDRLASTCMHCSKLYLT